MAGKLQARRRLYFCRKETCVMNKKNKLVFIIKEEIK